MRGISKINNFLSASAKINSQKHVGNEYGLFSLSSNQEVEIKRELTKFLRLNSGDRLKLIQLTDWKKELLTAFPESESYWFGIVPEGYSLNGLSPKEYLIGLLIEEFQEQPIEVYLVEVEPTSYYACSYEEYIFKTSNFLFFLSLQVHD